MEVTGFQVVAKMLVERHCSVYMSMSMVLVDLFSRCKEILGSKFYMYFFNLKIRVVIFL